MASTLDVILRSVQANLVTVGICTPSQSIITLSLEPPPTAGTFLCFITPTDFGSVVIQNDGAGRWASGMRGAFRVHVVTENMQDIAYQDAQFITNATLGIMWKVNQVINAMQDYFPLDGSGAILTEEPIRLTQIGSPRRYGQAYNWGGVPLNFEVTLAQNLTLPGP